MFTQVQNLLAETNKMQLLLMVGGIILFFFFLRSIFTVLFSMNKDKLHEKRIKQLDFNHDKADVTEADLINRVTAPIIKYVFPKLKPRSMHELEQDLKFINWDEKINAQQFVALNYILKAAGVLVGIIAWNLLSPTFGCVLFAVLFFGLHFMLNNSVKEKKQKVFSEFPDFIRVIQGYLTAGIPLSRAVEEAFPYMSPAWQDIMKNFIINTRLLSVEDALEKIKEDVDVFEIQEFFSLIQLNLKQGIDIKASFNSQREKVADMQYEVLMNKIGRRQMMGVLLQGPLLLTMIVAFGLPTLYEMVNF